MIEALLAPLSLQIFIGVTGPLAFLLVVRTQRFVWLGYLLGLIGQPVWLYVTFVSGHWGFFVNALVWTFIWMQGVWENVLKPAWQRRMHVSSAR